MMYQKYEKDTIKAGEDFIRHSEKACPFCALAEINKML
jgi:hypothetical protein